MDDEKAVEVVRTEKGLGAAVMLFAEHRELHVRAPDRDEGMLKEQGCILLQQLGESFAGWVEVVLVLGFDDEARSYGDSAWKNDLLVFRMHCDKVNIRKPVGDRHGDAFCDQAPVTGLQPKPRKLTASI
jgi:hypothetical protein